MIEHTFMPFNIFCVNNVINNVYVTLKCDRDYAIIDLVCWLHTTRCLCIFYIVHLLLSDLLLGKNIFLHRWLNDAVQRNNIEYPIYLTI